MDCIIFTIYCAFVVFCMSENARIPDYTSTFFVLFQPRHEKTNNVVSEQGGHKLSCTCTEDG